LLHFDFEASSLERHEFVNGVLCPLNSHCKQKNRLVGRLVRLLDAFAELKSGDVFFSTVKLKVSDDIYRYPDVVVTCEENTDEYLVQAPCAVFEVQAETARNGGEKLEEYLKIPSLNRYVLLRQDRALAMVYSRQGDSWRFDLLENTGEFDVPCINA
jgi:Uma2 family endonuclease